MSSSTSSQFETAVMIRRVIFFLTLLTFTWLHLFPLFRGLNSPQAMDQAQIGRQIARGEGFTTKFIRPLAYDEASRVANGPVSFAAFKDTYHAPLNPIVLGAVLKLVGADKPDSWEIGKNELLYNLDRVVALVSTLFFLMAIGVSYLLISRIFDAKIAGVTATLMMLCDLYWQFSQSGLPQMLLLLLFSCGLYFTYRATEAAQEGRVAMAPALTGAFFFVLMVLTHWLTAWIFFGYLIYAAIVFRPRGIVALSALAMLALAIAFPLMRSNGVAGHPFGTAFYVLYNGLSGGGESMVMRTHDLNTQPLVLNGMLTKILSTTLLQLTEIIPFLGGMLVAPLFFLALLHPFKRLSIASFRWGVALMWIFAALGMSIFGLDRGTPLDSNQIHILFAPVMAAYGLALVSILWSRLEVVNSLPFLRNFHHIIVIILCAAPMLMSLPAKATVGLIHRDRGIPNYPPYLPPVLNIAVPQFAPLEKGEQKVVVSDQPWAVAWYADRLSVWMPRTVKGFEEMESQAAQTGTPFAGILVTPSSSEAGTIRQVKEQYGEFTSLVFNGLAIDATAPSFNQPGHTLFDKDPKLANLISRYPNMEPLFGRDIIFYGERRMTQPVGNK